MKRQMNSKNNIIKSILAFGIVLILVVVGIVLDALDQSTDVLPNENTVINLYGETHGYERCYEIELEEWGKYYSDGCRNLFVELPYYSAELLNVWMHADSDDLIDVWFDEIQQTQSGNEYYYDFWHKLKECYPETVLYGTDVGHQYDTTGQRYLEYLSANGLMGSDNYILAEENIQQGIEFMQDDSEHNGTTELRESYMISNFEDAYARCGGGRIMGIYGSYHTNLYNAGYMAGRLKEYYGDIISSINTTNIAFEEIKRPYNLGFSVTGFVFLIMLFVPNIIWACKKKPEGYEASAQKENKILLTFERVGEVLVSVSLVIFTAVNPKIMRLGGLYFEWTIILWFTAAVLMILYECYWIKYFNSAKTMEDLYMTFMGFPVAGATLPVIACLLLGICSNNLIVLCSSVILGIGHIGIHLMHRRELD